MDMPDSEDFDIIPYKYEKPFHEILPMNTRTDVDNCVQRLPSGGKQVVFFEGKMWIIFKKIHSEYDFIKAPDEFQ